MGLLTELALLPLAPVRGVVWIANRMTDAAEDELHDPAAVRARLVVLNQALENGEIGMEEFEREEERLLDLLERRSGTAVVGAERGMGHR
ncbi:MULTISPECIES: gas vesicle protein GvpG [Streptomyces]|uniref:gas vesicle protein GvpG n=1 Tax=Streptomyces TaxID=1883 RepID=UPI001D1529A3|nr:MULTISPECIES: gas vesicle protein GvpG [Streptomyces]MCC3650046.1 gas vesicle protein GvpG [Streptomyces sp. S07_1.15]WSQ74927.1 gas vesicle protein GvpG [Streptomyces xinghaiensis]